MDSSLNLSRSSSFRRVSVVFHHLNIPLLHQDLLNPLDLFKAAHFIFNLPFQTPLPQLDLLVQLVSFPIVKSRRLQLSSHLQLRLPIAVYPP